MNVQIASQQPPTTAKVIVYTSHGQIDIELWTKQAPLASKNFIQHCLDGYYVNTIFHRLIPGFMIQGGDPTGTGMGGESIYGGPFRDQFHQRLKFMRRGIVAMANAGKNTNKSQFFITFGPCEHLNKKHTIFGKVVGDTIYNLMALQSLDTGEQDKPLDPPIIRKIKVVQHPFTDIKLKTDQQTENKKVLNDEQKSDQRLLQKNQKQTKNKKQEIKKLKNKKKLTFEDDEQDEGTTNKIISSHDVLYKKDASLSNKLSITKEEIQKKRKEKQLQEKKAEYIKNTLTLTEKNNIQQNAEDDQNGDVTKMISKQMQKKRVQFDKNINQLNNDKDQALNYVKRYNPTTKKYEIVFQDQLYRQKAEQQQKQELQRKARKQQEITDQKLKQVREMQLQQYNLLKADELNFKRAKEGSLKERRKEIIEQEKKLLSNLQKHRYEYTKKQKMDRHEGELFKKLIDFSSRLKSVKGKQETNEQKLETDIIQAKPKQISQVKNSWMSHQLKFHIDSTNAYSLEQKAMKVKGANYQDDDDGGLKMEVQYNNYDDENNQKQIEDVLRDL